MTILLFKMYIKQQCLYTYLNNQVTFLRIRKCVLLLICDLEVPYKGFNVNLTHRVVTIDMYIVLCGDKR